MMKASIDEKEIEKFSKLSSNWWDEEGEFKELHELNPVRLRYIKDKALQHFAGKLIEDLSFLDIGCGGGILSEPLARMGGSVTGIDASAAAIEVAKMHAGVLDINYINISAEELSAQETKFDVVLCMEIVEHVADLSSFLNAACNLVKPGGMIYISTINRTIKSYLSAIVAAEYLLRMVPRGTHDWQKFLKPSEIVRILASNNLIAQDIKGCSYNPLKGSKWAISDNIDVNYMLYATK